ncbi:MAG TPA: NAD(+)/NADH kinase, partial [Nocardioidaceae bacterium]|nr:NAD(+)/NADH kinase [Nocardioidaceae bacterium]
MTDETPGDDRRVLLVVHTGRTEAIGVACAVANRLAAAGVRVRVLDTDAPSLDIAAAEVVPADGQAASGCEMALVIGGDGTILRGAELSRLADTPLLGINLGHVGFMAEAEWDDVDSTVVAIVDR